MYFRIAILSIFLFVLPHIVRLIYSMGYHLHYYQHYPGRCMQVEGIEFGSANFHTLPDGKTFITTGLNTNAFSQSFQSHYRNKNIFGSIYTLNLNDTMPTVTPLLITSEKHKFNLGTFRPHGISIWPDLSEGHHLLYVVNHPPKEADRIEKFRYIPGTHTLHHIKTYSHSKLRAIFDVQAVGEDSFYSTNVLYEQKSRFFMLLELFSLMPWSGVVFYSGESGYRDVVSGLTSATGIVMSQCGMFLYVSLCLGSEIRVYKRMGDNFLILQQSYPLHTHPDAAVFDPNTGDLFIGAHPIAYQYFKHLDKPWLHKAASQVLHLRVSEGNITSVTELLYDDGELVSGSSAAVVFQKKLLIGSSVDKMVLCDVSVPI